MQIKTLGVDLGKTAWAVVAMDAARQSGELATRASP
jgi:hypothetical protein